MELEDSLLLEPDLVREISKKVAVIRDRILAAQRKQKSYVNKRHRFLEFAVYLVMSKVSPMKGVRLFGKKTKLTPRFVGPFRIVDRIGAVSYLLDLPKSMASVRDVFHIFMMRKHLQGAAARS